MPTDAHASAITALGNLGPLRVWSLLVTVFGDLSLDEPMDGPTLTAIMAGIGIRPEATRVALHRLRSDGWISSEKQGRTSLHSLTDKGKRNSAAARPRIYGRPEQMGQEVEVVLMRYAEAEPDLSLFAQIAPRIYIAGRGTPLPKDSMALAPMHLPDWLGTQIETETLRDGYQSLHEVLGIIDATLPKGTPMSLLDIAVLRVMIVHAWRRLVLKHPDLPRDAHSPDWRGHDCRALVKTLLDRFPRPVLDQLKAA